MRHHRLNYLDKRSFYEQPLEKDVTVSINHKNIQALTTLMPKIKYTLTLKLFLKYFYDK